MDADGWGLVVNIGAMIISVVSAFIARTALIQTRHDIFESQRDALILAMVDNDNRCGHLTLQSAFAREELERVIPSIVHLETKERAIKLLGHIAEIEKVTASLDGREYSEDDLDSLKFSEVALDTLRRMARGEQVNAKHLSTESYDLVFSQVERFVSKL